MYGTVAQLKTSFGSMESLVINDTTDQELTSILEETSGIIDNYIGIVVSLPMESSSHLLNAISIALARAEIYRRNARNDIPESVSKQEAKAYKDLEKIQQKKILIVAPEDEEEIDGFVETSDPFMNAWSD